MNTPTEWKTTARVTNPERLRFWREVFGGDTIPILSFVSSAANVPGHPNARVYWLDLKVITVEQRDRLIAGLALKFHLPIAEVAAGIDKMGVPVLADDVAVSSTDQGLFMSVVLDEEE